MKQLKARPSAEQQLYLGGEIREEHSLWELVV